MAKICVQPIDKTLAVIYVPRFGSPFEAMRIAVSTCGEGRRKPALQLQKHPRRETALFINHDDAHRGHDCDYGGDRCKRRLRAEKVPPALRGPRRRLGACLRSHGRAECEEPCLETQ